MRLGLFAVAAALSVALAGCTASVRYAPRVAGVIPGYVEQRLGEDTYQVKIGEAWPKDWPDLEKFALYRASEITQGATKRYFAVLTSSTRVKSYAIALPSTTSTTATVTPAGSAVAINATSTTTGGGSVNISGGWYTLEFRVIDDAETGSYKDVIDSQRIIADLKYFIDSRR